MSERRSPFRWWVWLIAGLLLLVLIAALAKWWQPLYEFIADQEQVKTWVRTLGVWGPLAIVLLEMAQALLIFIPGQAIEAVSGYLYGPWLGTLYAMLGIAIGSFVVFSLSHRFGRPLVRHMIGQQSMDRLDDLVRRGGSLFFFLIWLLPFAPDDLACLAAGLTSMPPLRFVLLMLLGRLPGIFVSVWLGANLTRIEPVWLAALFAVIAVAALVLWHWGEQIQESVLGFVERLSRR
jgi:uncharacterized membrane protein YdjX (TVP38/TMEM64 family)